CRCWNNGKIGSMLCKICVFSHRVSMQRKACLQANKEIPVQKGARQRKAAEVMALAGTDALKGR
ncbi:MAG: hypothetical protein RSD45_01940, partial [Gordonibacter sp.]